MYSETWCVCVCVSSVVVPCRGPALQARPAGIVSTAPDLQPKPPASSSTSDDANKASGGWGTGRLVCRNQFLA